MKMDAHGRGGLSRAQYPRQSAASVSFRYSGVVSDEDVFYTSGDKFEDKLGGKQRCQMYFTANLKPTRRNRFPTPALTTMFLLTAARRTGGQLRAKIF